VAASQTCSSTSPYTQRNKPYCILSSCHTCILSAIFLSTKATPTAKKKQREASSNTKQTTHLQRTKLCTRPVSHVSASIYRSTEESQALVSYLPCVASSEIYEPSQGGKEQIFNNKTRTYCGFSTLIKMDSIR